MPDKTPAIIEELKTDKLWIRPQRGLLSDAMSEAIQIPATLDAIVDYFKSTYKGWEPNLDSSNIQIFYCDYDERIRWDTYIVVLITGGVLGYIAPISNFTGDHHD